jgi:predicted Zn-dependent peptidase
MSSACALRLRHALLPVALTCTAGLLAPPARADEVATTGGVRPVTLTVQMAHLGNGLEVLLHEDHRTPIVSVNLWYHVGSKDEPAGKNGFAHLFEHVMFQGSRHVAEGTYVRDLEQAGGTSINGSTSTDRTNYFETVPRNRLDLALWLESDRMGFLLDHIEEATFSAQRDVVKNERRQNYEGAPYGMVEQLLVEQMYPDSHPYHRVSIGSPQDLDAATLDDVRAFFRTWYLPNNATLVIAGDVDAAAALALAERYFGPIPAGPVPDRRAWDDPPAVTLTGEKTLDVAAGVELPRVYLAWPTPPSFRSGDGELDLAASVLTGGKTSRLYKRLVYDARIAQSVEAHEDSRQLGSKFVIIATAQPGHSADELREAIDDELGRLSSGGVTPAELGRAKARALAGLVFDLEHDSERANLINLYNQLAHDPGFLPRDMDRYATATAEGVADAARRYLPHGRRVVAVVTPDRTAPVCGVLRGSREVPARLTTADVAPPPPAAPVSPGVR